MRWYENDGLWSGFGELMFSERRAVEAEANVADSPLLKFTPGTRVLDLCCGPGLYVVPLARRGHAVTGVDLNQEMLDRAASVCAEAGVEARLEQGDMGDYVRPGEFDVVINMYTSFGYFAEPERNLQVLRNAHESLVPGGQILMDLLGKEVLASWVGRPQAVDLPDGVAFMRDTVLDDWTRLRTDWTLVRDGAVHQASIVSFVYSAAEMRAMLEQAGFVDIECFGGFDGSTYDNHAKRLIVRGTRPR
ncbi:class I SAM-dependent methyltransferase [Micromonospora inyonensis]|uniref:Methyltransferase domain-containing protein n=1 Tax=Micromonospora inyonensis TaxID=47866 RepID=A0A1C6RE82_9ACTN|nr:class I SAM-dependent methyltransferase [Micromonospora inyonensis]SCL15460.1 Methyltransferase domain-containing protein [Micromonospora inyonensis]